MSGLSLCFPKTCEFLKKQFIMQTLIQNLSERLMFSLLSHIIAISPPVFLSSSLHLKALCINGLPFLDSFVRLHEVQKFQDETSKFWFLFQDETSKFWILFQDETSSEFCSVLNQFVEELESPILRDSLQTGINKYSLIFFVQFSTEKHHLFLTKRSLLWFDKSCSLFSRLII